MARFRTRSTWSVATQRANWFGTVRPVPAFKAIALGVRGSKNKTHILHVSCSRNYVAHGVKGGGCTTDAVGRTILGAKHELTISPSKSIVTFALSREFAKASAKAVVMANWLVAKVPAPSLKARHRAVVANEACVTVTRAHVTHPVTASFLASGNIHTQQLTG